MGVHPIHPSGTTSWSSNPWSSILLIGYTYSFVGIGLCSTYGCFELSNLSCHPAYFQVDESLSRMLFRMISLCMMLSYRRTSNTPFYCITTARWVLLYTWVIYYLSIRACITPASRILFSQCKCIERAVILFLFFRFAIILKGDVW